VHITRLKGHGEANKEEIESYAMNWKTRKLYQLCLGKDDCALILRYMDKRNASVRKEILGIQED